MSETLTLLGLFVASGVMTIAERVCGVKKGRKKGNTHDFETCTKGVSWSILASLCACCIASLVLAFVHPQAGAATSCVFIGSIVAFGMYGYSNIEKFRFSL